MVLGALLSVHNCAHVYIHVRGYIVLEIFSLMRVFHIVISLYSVPLFFLTNYKDLDTSTTYILINCVKIILFDIYSIDYCKTTKIHGMF